MSSLTCQKIQNTVYRRKVVYRGKHHTGPVCILTCCKNNTIITNYMLLTIRHWWYPHHRFLSLVPWPCRQLYRWMGTSCRLDSCGHLHLWVTAGNRDLHTGACCGHDSCTIYCRTERRNPIYSTEFLDYQRHLKISNTWTVNKWLHSSTFYYSRKETI